VSFECDIEEETFAPEMHGGAAEYGGQLVATQVDHGKGYGTMYIPADAKVERVIDLPVGTVLRRKSDGLLEWKVRDCEWRCAWTHVTSGSSILKDRWTDSDAQTRIDFGQYEIIYKPEADS
jgi:hypothetical protein